MNMFVNNKSYMEELISFYGPNVMILFKYMIATSSDAYGLLGRFGAFGLSKSNNSFNTAKYNGGMIYNRVYYSEIKNDKKIKDFIKNINEIII